MIQQCCMQHVASIWPGLNVKHVFPRCRISPNGPTYLACPPSSTNLSFSNNTSMVVPSYSYGMTLTPQITASNRSWKTFEMTDSHSQIIHQPMRVTKRIQNGQRVWSHLSCQLFRVGRTFCRADQWHAPVGVCRTTQKALTVTVTRRPTGVCGPRPRANEGENACKCMRVALGRSQIVFRSAAPPFTLKRAQGLWSCSEFHEAWIKRW